MKPDEFIVFFNQKNNDTGNKTQKIRKGSNQISVSVINCHFQSPPLCKQIELFFLGFIFLVLIMILLIPNFNNPKFPVVTRLNDDISCPYLFYPLGNLWR